VRVQQSNAVTVLHAYWYFGCDGRHTIRVLNAFAMQLSENNNEKHHTSPMTACHNAGRRWGVPARESFLYSFQ
jgi:hypothetical protein